MRKGARQSASVEMSVTNDVDFSESDIDYDSSPDFELGKEDVCESDTEWSDSDVLSLGVKCQESVQRKMKPFNEDSDSDDSLPLCILARGGQRGRIQPRDPLMSQLQAPSSTDTVGIPSTSTQPPPTVAIPSFETADRLSATLLGSDTSAMSSEVIENIIDKRSRKRQRNPEQWKRNKVKKLKNSGCAYVGFTGRIVEEKSMGPGCGEKCVKKCHEQFDASERRDIFSNFWKSGDINVQRQFILSCVTKRIPDRVRTKNPSSRRKFTLLYSFIKNNERKAICRSFFLDTLNIKQDVVYGALDKASEGGVVSLDQRGSHDKHVTVGEEIVEKIKEHIRSFPTIPSHYCRHDSNKMYLEAGLNISTMYRLYKDIEVSKGNTYATQSKYREIFNSKFNLAFFSPKKDQCDQCLSYTAIENPTEDEREKHNEHLKRKEKAREYKALIKEQATDNPFTVASCFDLQKVLQCPHGEASSFYYKRKLSVYNLTFFDMASHDVQCYLWPEHISSRGANQIASCLWHYIQMKVAGNTKEFYFISDNCSGQNRNRFIATMFWYCMNTLPSIDKIEHGFLEVGHTQNENDSVHSVISRASKRIPVYTPEQWASVVRGARRSKNPYSVKEMAGGDFFDWKIIAKGVKNFDYDTDGQKVKWTKIRAIVFDKADKNVMSIRYDDTTCKVDLMRRQRKSEDSNGQMVLQVLNEPVGVSQEKKSDLVSLCNSNLIPPVHQNYFFGLPVMNNS